MQIAEIEMPSLAPSEIVTLPSKERQKMSDNGRRPASVLDVVTAVSAFVGMLAIVGALIVYFTTGFASNAINAQSFLNIERHLSAQDGRLDVYDSRQREQDVRLARIEASGKCK